MKAQPPANGFIGEITLQNLLSFGPEPTTLRCQALNVFIGPNASGKSNFLEAIGLLAACPSNLQEAIRHGGGIQEWLWKGTGTPPVATLQAKVKVARVALPLRYEIRLTEVGQRMEILSELLEPVQSGPGRAKPTWFIRGQNSGLPRGQSSPLLRGQNSPLLRGQNSPLLRGQGHALLRGHSPAKPARVPPVDVTDLSPQQSILAQRRDPTSYPELTFLAESLAQIRLYRDWNLGGSSVLRLPQRADMPEDFLLEDAANLGLVLNELSHHPQAGKRITEYLRKFYETAEDYAVRVIGGTVQVVIHETGPGNPVIPAARLSDGTLRYLCLLAVLCHPNPPPVVCLEEPEIGLHPDMIATVAELLRAASQRTQLFVTTHSDALVDALTDAPDTVVICERGDNGTRLKRLDSDKLKDWLKRYSLGELWMKGEIGGARW